MSTTKQPDYRIKSYSLPADLVEIINSVAWSRRVSASAVVAWAVVLLQELLAGEGEGADGE